MFQPFGVLLAQEPDAVVAAVEIAAVEESAPGDYILFKLTADQPLLLFPWCTTITLAI